MEEPTAAVIGVVEHCGTSKAPEGWYCTRDLGHDGPCAAKRQSGRPRISFDELPDHTMSLVEQIRMVSKRIRRPNIPHKEYMELNRLLNELRSQTKLRHLRSQNGVNIQEIQRKEARLKRQALAANKENDHGTEQ
jgi:hypothetical protein